MKGQFIISLDFEKFWGVFDSHNDDNYKENLRMVDKVVDRLLELSDEYNIKLTFATVGFLFNRNKTELIKNTPEHLPTYTDKLHNPYPLVNKLSDEDLKDNIYFAQDSLIKIHEAGIHEIATHTYCHYYCMEDGQTLEQFESDLKMAKKLAENIGVTIKSIVFPRNQAHLEYIRLSHENGLISFRGNENHDIYEARPKKATKKPMDRIRRILDAYFNITGYHIYNLNNLKTENYIVDLPSSYFLRPFNKKLSFLERFKINRIKKSMKKAAINDFMYHLWFHPHNFGRNMDDNFKNLESIFKYYKKLNRSYGFNSTTMDELAEKLRSN